jgi:hypothetical protein
MLSVVWKLLEEFALLGTIWAQICIHFHTEARTLLAAIVLVNA